jgi:cold shock protein
VTGVVTFWKQNENGRPAGWGFVHCDEPDNNGESQRIFVHFSDIKSGGFRYLTEGDMISFEIQETEKGFKAINVEVKELSPGQ